VVWVQVPNYDEFAESYQVLDSSIFGMPQAGGDRERAMFELHSFGGLSAGSTGARAIGVGAGDFAKWSSFLVFVQQRK
jgi:hypothetical protein